MTDLAEPIAVTNGPSLKELLAVEARGSERTARPKNPPLAHLKLAPAVFQRRVDATMVMSGQTHIRIMAKALKETKRPLEALLVIQIGGQPFVVDGHHRHAAYTEAKWLKGVPVSYYSGTVAAARDEALALNLRGKLGLTYEDLLEAAWHDAISFHLKEPGHKSKKASAAATSINENKISAMRRMLNSDPTLQELSWDQAHRTLRPTKQQADDEDWLEDAAQKLVKQLLQNTGGKFQTYPEVIARALQLINPELPAKLIREWPEEVRKFVKERDDLQAQFDI
jgi:hypothetical protein